MKAILIFWTSDPKIADAKTRSKWSRVLLYAARAQPPGQRLTVLSNPMAALTNVRASLPGSGRSAREMLTAYRDVKCLYPLKYAGSGADIARGRYVTGSSNQEYRQAAGI